MARYAVIENNICTNIVEAESDQAQDNYILLSDTDAVSYNSVYDPSTSTWTRASHKDELRLSDEDIVMLAKKELIDTDWTQLSDVGLTAANVEEWKVYRKSLRQIKDGTMTYEDWPLMPDKEYL